MTLSFRTTLAALLALGAFSTGAQAIDFQSGGAPKLKAVAAQLGIISPANNACPGNAKLTAWITTNKPGTINIMIVRQGGSVAGPYPVTTVAAANGKAMGSYTKMLAVAQPIDAQYRVVIGNSTVASNWAPLVAHC